MRMQSPSLVVASSHSRLGNAIRLRNKPARLFALLALIAVAATALAATSSSAQLLFGKASAIIGLSSAPSAVQAAPVNPTLTVPNAPLPPSDIMLVARRGHTATRLSNGSVLIAGGEDSSGVLNECEIYDPTSTTFSVTGNLGAARADHSATLLADGRVLIVGGRDGAGALNTTEIFDPTTGAFASGPAMSVARAGHSATLFADGRIFIAGGDVNGSAEIFDPSSSSFSAVSANMNTARSMHSAALLADGRVLLVGGRNASGDALSSGEIFDTEGGSFSTVEGALKIARVRGHLRVLFDGKVQIIGGSDDGSMEIYDPIYGGFGAYAHVLPESDTCAGLPGQVLASQTRAALFHNGQSDPLFDRTGHTITEMNGQALVLGGANSNGTVLTSSSVLASSSASITTDKMDYAPGETVAISGRGFQPGETVRLKIHEDPHTPQERGFDAVADASGNFSGEYLVMDYDLKMKFIVGARGLTSGATAQTTFTDDKGLTITFAGTGGGSITFSAVSGVTQPSTNPCTGTCSNQVDNTATGTLTVTPNPGSVFAGWSLGTSGLTSTTPACTGTNNPCRFSMGGSAQSVTATFTATSIATTLTLSAPTPASVQFGSSGPVTLSATLTRTSGGAAVVGATVNFTVDAFSVGSAVTNGSGVASITTYNPSTLTIGGHNVQASFTGATISGTTYTSSTSGTQTLTVTKADQTITFGALANRTYGDADFGVSATASSSLAVTFSSQTLSTCTVSSSTVHIVAAGGCTVRASQAGNGNYNAAPNVDQSFTVNPKTLTASIIGNPTKPYDGNNSATLAPANFSLSGLVGSDSFTVTKTTGTYNTADVATATTVTTSLVAGDFTAGVGTSASNYTLPTTASGAGQITQAASTTTIDCSPGSFTYTGSAITPCTATVTRVGDANTTTSVTYANNINVGTATADAAYAGDANHTGSTATQVTFSITQAASTTTIDCSPGSFTYTGSAITPCTATVTRVGDANTTTSVSYANNVNVGTATADAAYAGDANHTGSTATQVSFSITQAASTTTIDCSPGSFTYTGSAITPCTATVTRVGDANTTTSVTYANNVNVGTATADAAYAGDANHTGSTATQVTFAITQAASTTTIDCSPGSFTYTGSAITPCTATVTRVGDANTTTSVTYANNINVGTATADAAYAGDANHTGSTATQVTFAITQAASTTSIDCSPSSFTYTGSAITPCTATVTGVGDANTSTSVTYANNVNVGTATADAAYAGDANHTGSTATQVTFAITQAASTTSIDCSPGTFTYTGSAITPCTATVTRVGDANTTTSVTYANNVNVGTATADAAYAGDANHTGSTATQVTFAITQAASTTSIDCSPGSFTYTGSAITPCTATVTRVGDANTSTSVTYANNINVGTATADAAYAGDANHTGSTATQVTFAITQAASTTSIDCSPSSFTYTGSAITPCTATVTRVGDANTTTSVTYANNVNVGTATADAAYAGDANHTGSTATQVTFAITQAASTTTIDCSPGSFTYTGSAITPCTATVTRVGDANTSTSVTYANNINVGTATADAAYAGDANHAGSTATQVTFSITQAASTTTIDCSPGSFTYTGSAITPCFATVTRVGDANTTTSVTYANNINVGTATADAAYAGDANHTGSTATQVTFAITQAASTTTIDCSPGSFTYTGAAIEPCTATVTRVGDANTSTSVTYANNINVGTATADAAYAGDANHTGSTATQVTFSIIKRAITVTAVADSKPYDGNTSSAGVPTFSPALVGTDSPSFTQTFDNRNAGTGKTLTPTGLVSDGNGGNNYSYTYTPVSTGEITKRAVTVTAVAATKPYDGNASSTGVPTFSPALIAPDSPSFTQTFDNRNAGTGKTLTPAGLVSDGNGGNNYSYTYTPVSTGEITKRAVTVTAVAATKPYDGNTSSTALPTFSPALIAPDSPSFTQTFNNRNAGTGKTLTPTGLVSDGNGGNNYSYTYTPVSTGVITKRAITVTAVTSTKIYDTNTNSTGVPTFSPALIGPDTASFTQTYDTPLVGTGKTLTPAGLAGDGNSGNNYSYTYTPVSTGVITTGYCFNGFLSPIGGSVETLNGGSFTDPLRAFKLGSTIPVKFAIASWNGTTCGATVITGIHTLQATRYSTAVDSDPPIDATPTDAATTGNQFRLTDSQWHFNLSTKGGGFSQGTWLLTATLQDGSIHTVWISIKK